MTEPSTINRLRGLEDHLRERIRGQDHLLPRLAASFCRAALGLPSPERPRASLLLVGPTGTGKSESFTCACDYVFGAGHVITFDLSEYQDETGVNRLLGESRSDPGLLGLALSETRTGGLLFDEIEKAHPRVLDLFLQMLWRGCVTDSTGRTHHLAEFVIGFTSNLGAADVMRMEYASLASTTQAILRRVGEGLRPELLGRIDETLVFARLSPTVQREICLLEVAKETERLRGIGYDLEFSEQAIEYLVRHGFSPRFGARPLRKTVERSLQNAVVQALFVAGIARGRLQPADTGNRLELSG